MNTTPIETTETNTIDNHRERDDNAVASIKLDDVTGGGWYPYGAWGGWGGGGWAGWGGPSPARYAAFEQRRADWFAANAPGPGPGRYPWSWGPCR